MTTENSRIEKSSSTRLNSGRGFAATSVNIQGENAADIRTGMSLPGNYTILDRLQVCSGEADLYTCRDGKDNLLIAKIYRRKNAVKKDILETLSSVPESPYIAGIYDYGEINGYPFTIVPWFRNGSLAGKKFTAEEIKRLVVPCVNSGLEFLHSHRIMHKDIKPSNLMLSDDMSGILIADFGISSLAGDGQSIVVTGTGMSPEYSAPETFSNIFLEESDYYSLGISLYELFTGSTPFSSHDGLTDDEIIASASVQSIPFGSDFPEDLKNLIKGLTYKDLSNRRDKSNPNRRWTGREVELWLINEPQSVPGEVFFSSASVMNGRSRNSNGCKSGDGYKPEGAYRFSRAYTFPGKDGKSCLYETLPGLADSLASNWDQGKKHVGRGFLSKFFMEDGNQQLASLVMDCEDEKTTDFAYFKLLFNLLSENGEPYFCWMNVRYPDLTGLSEYLSGRLSGLKEDAHKNPDHKDPQNHDDMIQKGFENKSQPGHEDNALKSFETEFGDLLKALEYWYENSSQNDNLEIIRKIRDTYNTGYFSLTAKIIILSSFLDPALPVKIRDRAYSSPAEFREEYMKLQSAGDGSSGRFVRENRELIRGYGSCLNAEIKSAFNEALEKLKEIETEEEREKQEALEKEHLQRANRAAVENERNRSGRREQEDEENTWTAGKTGTGAGAGAGKSWEAEKEAKTGGNRKTEEIWETEDETEENHDAYSGESHCWKSENSDSSRNGRSGWASGWTPGAGSGRRKTDRLSVFQDCMNNGECILFGRFFIRYDNRYDPLTWKVLSVDRDGRRALLITEFGIDSMPYIVEESSADSWEHSHIRDWLNDMFLSTAFYPDELSAIQFSEIESYRYQLTSDDLRNLLYKGIDATMSGIFNSFGDYGTITARVTNGLDNLVRENSNIGSYETTVLRDRVFLLNAEEAKRYMPDKKSRRCKPTQFAVMNNRSIRSGYWTSWWLRGDKENLGGAVNTDLNQLNINIHGSNFTSNGFALSGFTVYGACVDDSGHVSGTGKNSKDISCVRDDFLVRPAIWVDINSEIFDRIERYRPQEDDRTKGRNGYYEL